MAPSPLGSGLIEEQLTRILADSRFISSERLSQFLRFVVQKAIQGKAADIKEYSIAVEVYGRRPSHDARLDSIVRVEASRLRSKLRAYYEHEGASDPVLITLPRGSYVPHFANRPTAAPPAPAVPLHDSTAAENVQELPLAGQPPPARLPVRRVAVLLVAVATITAFAMWKAYRAPSAEIRSLAVLPFLALGSDPAIDGFADGFTEELTAQFANVNGLRVASRTAAFQFKDRAVNAGTIARELGVDGIVEGSVRQAGSRFRITAQLVHAGTGYHLWAENYESAMTDPLALQREVANRIRTELTAKLTGQESWTRLSDRQQSPPPLYLQAHELMREDTSDQQWSGRVPENLQQAIQLFEQVTVRHPEFARGWLSLAEALDQATEFDPGSRDAVNKRVKSLLDRAIQLDSGIADAHALRGAILFYSEWEFRAAEEAFARAVAIEQRNAYTLAEYVDLLRILGRFDEARQHLEHALVLEPRSPLLRIQRGLLLYDIGRLPEARREAAAAEALKPTETRGAWLAGLTLEREGKLNEAEASYRRALQVFPEDGRALPALGHVLGKMGRRTEALEILSHLQSLRSRGKAVDYSVALVTAGLDDRDLTLRWLEQAWNRRDASLPYLQLEPRFGFVMDDPRFVELGRRLGLPRTARVSLPQ